MGQLRAAGGAAGDTPGLDDSGDEAAIADGMAQSGEAGAATHTDSGSATESGNDSGWGKDSAGHTASRLAHRPDPLSHHVPREFLICLVGHGAAEQGLKNGAILCMCYNYMGFEGAWHKPFAYGWISVTLSVETYQSIVDGAASLASGSTRGGFDPP